jgi:hypothetical protein
VVIPNIKKGTIYLCLREATDRQAITRMAMQYPNDGEIYYLRRILLRASVRDANDARKDHNNSTHDTYQQRAIADGFIHEHAEATACFDEALISSTPAQLRSLFIKLMIQGYPVRTIFDDLTHRRRMLEDFLHRDDNERTAMNSFLTDCENQLRLESRTLTTYGFELPVGCITELEMERLRHSAVDNEQLLQRLNNDYPHNNTQQHHFSAFEGIVTNWINDEETDVQHRNHVCIFINGLGGCGKSELMKKFHAYCRSKGLLIMICAATTLAARIYPDGITAHNLFNYPVVEEVLHHLTLPVHNQSFVIRYMHSIINSLTYT